MVRAGQTVATSYGCSVTGITTSDLQAVRAKACAMAFGVTTGRSSTLAMMLGQVRDFDLAYVFLVRPLHMWAMKYWTGSGSRRMMNVALDGAKKRATAGGRPALHGRGPAHALVAALGHLGWAAEQTACWTTHRGARIDLKEVAPATVRRMAGEAAFDWQYRLLADRHPELEPLRRGTLMEPIRKLLHSKKKKLGGARQRSALFNIATGALWPQDRLWQCGLVESRCCVACGCPEGTLRHLIWQCDCGWPLRRALVEDCVVKEAAGDAAEHLVWSRCLLPRPPMRLPPLGDRSMAAWGGADGARGLFEPGRIYTDGSVMVPGTALRPGAVSRRCSSAATWCPW